MSDLTDRERVVVYARELYQLRYRNSGLEAVAEAAKALLDAEEAFERAKEGTKWAARRDAAVLIGVAENALRTSLGALEETRGTG